MKQNKVAANLLQDYDTAEQKRARDNIGAMAASASSTFQSAGNYQTAGDYATRSELSNFVSVDQLALKLDATASSLLQPSGNYQTAGDYVSSSELADYQTTAGMSAFVPYSAVSADSANNVTSINGSSVGVFTGVNTTLNVTGDGTSGSPVGLNSSIVFTSSNRQNTVYADKVDFTAKVNPIEFYGTYRPWGWDISGSSTSTNDKTSLIQSTSYLAMYTTSDGGEKAHGYLTFRGCGFGESGTGGAGDEIHTNISTQGITSISGYMGTASSHTGFYLTNGNDPDRPLELKFESGASSAKVDIDSINRWNSLAQGIAESADPLGLGAQSASAAQTIYTGYNWTKRTVSASGLPDMEMYGFQTTPYGSGTYGINSAGSFTAINDHIVPYHTSDSALFARIGATTAAGKTPVFVGNSGTLMGYLGQISENKATFTKALSNGGTIVNYYVSSDNTVSSSQIRGFDGGVSYGAIHRSRNGSIYMQNSGNNNVWMLNGYCSGNWKWNDESDATHSLDEIYTGAAGVIDVYRYNWSFLLCHSTQDSMDSSYIAYFDVAPCLQLWGTGGTYTTSWCPSNNHVMVPVSGYTYGGSTYQSQWQKLDLRYDIPGNLLSGWTRNSAYNTVIVSPRIQLVGIQTYSNYHSLGIRMGTECVSFLNHL